MSTSITTPHAGRGRHLTASMVVVTLFAIASAVSACGVINKVKNVVHDVHGNKATIDAFDTKLQSGAATTFEATYVTTGTSPATIVYAVQPPQGVAFDDTPFRRERRHHVDGHCREPHWRIRLFPGPRFQ